LKEEVESYHEFLARSVFELKGTEFWDFHRNELKKLGYPVRAVKLIKALFLELLDFRETTRRIRHALKTRNMQKPSQDAKLDTVLSSIVTRTAESQSRG
jgi:hypothetical protein